MHPQALSGICASRKYATSYSLLCKEFPAFSDYKKIKLKMEELSKKKKINEPTKKEKQSRGL